MKLITIYNTIHSSEVSIIRHILEENGIQYVLPDMATDGASGLGGLGISGMRVQVPEEQQEDAVAVLKARGLS